MTLTAEQPVGHLIIIPFEAWGHVRALCVLASRLVQAKPLTITFFTTAALYDRIDTELTRSFHGDAIALKAHIRLVALRSEGTNPLDMRALDATFPEAYRALVNEGPITCVKTGKTLPGIPAPDAAVLDMFMFPLVTHIQTLSNKRVKIFCWSPCAAYATYSLVHLVVQGGLLKIMEQVAAQTGRSLEDVATEMLSGTRGMVDKLPGLPSMYDYEKEPQKMVIDMSVAGGLNLAAIQFLQECDGVIASSPACYEPAESLSGFSDWLGQRKLYCLGPLLPLDAPGHAAEVEKTLSADAAEIDAFMDSALRSHGEKSLIFISFGSFFWSVEPEKIWAFLDVLLEKNTPFIFSHGSPFATVPEEVSAKFKASGLGLLTRWAPQQAVLAHPATGWFVTHTGFNSVIESIVAGVPMICWPYQADQPVNVAHLTANLDVAYELIEVRTGEHGLKPIHRSGRTPVGTVAAVREEAAAMLDQAFGEDGAKKRANILKLRGDVLAAWDGDGPSRQTMKSFREAVHA